MSDAPKCKLCGVKHWFNEPHVSHETTHVLSSTHEKAKGQTKDNVRGRRMRATQDGKRVLQGPPRRVSERMAQGENAGTQGTEEPTRFDWVKRAQELGLP